MAFLSGKVIYLREEKASQFVPTSSVGIFVAQGDKGHKERILLSHEVDLWICKISSSTPFIYIPSFFNTIISLSGKKNLNFLLNMCFAIQDLDDPVVRVAVHSISDQWSRQLASTWVGT